MRTLKILFLAIIMPLLAYSQAPDWVTSFGESARHPDFVYLTGFGMASTKTGDNRGDTMEKAINNARRNLTEKIQVRLRSMVKSHVEESGQDLSDYFSATTQAITDMEISGLDWTNYYDRSTRTGYALAYVKREKLIGEYSDKADEIRKEIFDLLDNGKKQEESGKYTRALQTYLACYPLLNQLVEAQSIITAVHSSMTKLEQELEEAVTRDKVSIIEIRQAVERLVQRPVKSVDDLAWIIAYSVDQQMTTKKGPVLVVPFTYQDTKMSSAFARYFQQSISVKMVEVADWDVLQSVDISTMDGAAALQKYAAPRHTEYVLTGTYWEEPGGIKFIASLQAVADGRVMAGAEVLVPADIVNETGRDIKPQNFASAYHDQQIFQKDEVIDGGLSLEAWTNRGSENLIFTHGEEMRLFVRVNMPCYIRFIYHLADSTRTLLLDSHYIDRSKVNMVYRIPEEFECAAPYGAEVLQIFARTKPFDYIDTVYRDGYFLLREDLEKYMSKVRGFKRKEQNEPIEVEKRIIMTTMRN